MALCGRTGVPEESPGEAIAESTAPLHKRPQHFGDPGTIGQSSRRAAEAEWSLPEFGRQAVCVAEGGAGKMT